MGKVVMLRNLRDPETFETRLRGVNKLSDAGIQRLKAEYPADVVDIDDLTDEQKAEFIGDTAVEDVVPNAGNAPVKNGDTNKDAADKKAGK